MSTGAFYLERNSRGLKTATELLCSVEPMPPKEVTILCSGFSF